MALTNMALRRALHFVFKVGDRAKTATFYRDVLGMKVSSAVKHKEEEDEDKFSELHLNVGLD